jgi:DNA repair protein RadC
VNAKHASDLFGGIYSSPAHESVATELAVCERPRNRAKAFGPAALSDVEALALLLQGTSEDPAKAIECARALINRFGSLGALLGKHADQFEVAGLNEALALRLVAALEISRHVLSATSGAEPLLNRAELVAHFMAPRSAGLDVEKFWVLCLNRKNRLIRCVEVTSGTATAALAHPREVFRAAVTESASSIICVHNHPSGDPAPSAPDLHVTRQLREAAKAVDIELLDHVIVGRVAADPCGKGHFSFREAGML